MERKYFVIIERKLIFRCKTLVEDRRKEENVFKFNSRKKQINFFQVIYDDFSLNFFVSGKIFAVVA